MSAQKAAALVDRILAAPRGAEFMRADLQIHTPVDPRFTLPAGWNTDSVRDRERIASGYIEAAQASEVRILGITEHNDLTYAPFVRDAARGTNITVFPGIEFSLPPGLHLLALFEPDVDIDRLWDLIVKLGLGMKMDDRFHPDGTPKQVRSQLSDFVRLVDEYDGLVVAPHVCGPSGIFQLPEGQARIETWRNESILAADPGNGKEVAGLGAFERGAFENTHNHYRRNRAMPPIWTSDARSFQEIGRCQTWLKLCSPPNLEGLRQAFLDPESRIRHKDAFTGVKYPRILGVGWEGAGFLTDQVVAFNDNLNCLIGGKGVGKSSVIETLRFAFGLEPAADLRDGTRNHLKSVLPSGGAVTVVIESQEPRQVYVIERTQGGYAPVVKDKSGKVVSDVLPLDLLRPSIFGQKEIYGIAQRPSDQLRALDDFIQAPISELNTAESEIKKELEKNSSELVILQADNAEIAEQVADLPRLLQLKKRYEDLGIVLKLDQKTRFQRNFRRLARIRLQLSSFLGILNKIETGLASEDYALGTDESLRAELLKAQELLGETATDWSRSLETLRTAVSSRIATLDLLISQAEVSSAVVDADFRTISSEIHKDFPDAKIEDYLKLEQQIEAIAPLQREAEQKGARATTLRAERRTLMDRLLAVRRARYDERYRKSQDLSGRLEKALRIRVNFEGRVDNIRSGLEALKAGIRGTALDALFRHADFSLPALLDAVDGGPEEVKSRFGLTDASAASLVSVLAGKTRLDWDSFTVPDSIEIEFNVSPAGSEPQYRPLETLSVGQKSTAVLLLLLLKDDNPFIVDQPEDDLDNRFIYEDVVQRLREAKERRQFIVATHNANIPVLGDAEQIVVLNASSAQARIERSGSIDDRQIQGLVKIVLEGGEQAFEMRKAKYGF